MSSLKCVIKSLQRSKDIGRYISWSDRARLSCNRSMFRHRELPARDMGDWVCNHRYARVGTWTYLPASKSATCDPWYVAILAHAHTYASTNTKGSIVWVIVGVAWNAKYYLIERVTEPENDQGRHRRIERKTLSENYRDKLTITQKYDDELLEMVFLVLYEFLYNLLKVINYKLFIKNYK